MKNKELIELALKAKEQAYAEFSNFKVGAALLTSNEAVFLGCNIENRSFTPTVCAERVAIFSAIAQGERKFQKIAIVSDAEDLIIPCGVCLQVLSEFFDKKTQIILTNKQLKFEVKNISNLLPYNFNFEKKIKKE